MRRFGDKIYKLFLSRYYFLFFLAIFLILSSVFSYGFIARMCVTAVSCVLLVLLLLAANRAARIRDVVFYIIFSQYFLGVIASQLSTSVSRVIAIYQIINTTLISLLFFYFLSKIKICKIDECFKKNNLPWLATYFSAGLFLSIGLPFTSTFISEILIMREMMVFNPVFVVVLMVAMFLFTVSVLHALQDYVFKEKSIRRFSIRLSFFDHSVFCFLILFNVIGGIFPSVFINAISTGVQSL
jgi:NADH:ubiquinone oxidoreductase subunit 4 (subunit M)